jgi:hypothetical protein
LQEKDKQVTSKVNFIIIILLLPRVHACAAGVKQSVCVSSLSVRRLSSAQKLPDLEI